MYTQNYVTYMKYLNKVSTLEATYHHCHHLLRHHPLPKRKKKLNLTILKLEYKITHMANGWNISFVTLYSGQFTLSTQLIKPNYPVVLSHWHSTTVSSETYPLHPTSPLGGKLHYGGVPPIWLSLPPSLPPNTALPPEGSISSAERDTYKTKLPSL